MAKPFVSICCITYNHEPYIRECLDGFLMQKTDFDFEILIHDDASTDKTADIIREYELKYPEIINPIYQTENQYSKGVRPINKFNFERAQGKYIAMCEGDDYWTDPFKLQKQVDFLEANVDYVLAGHKRILVDEYGDQIENRNKNNIDYYTQCLLFKNILKDDYLNFNGSFIANGDTFLVLYLKNFGKAKVLDFIGSAYRISESGTWSLKTHQEKYEMALKSYNSMVIFFKRNNYLNSVRTVQGYIIDNELIYIQRLQKHLFLKSVKVVTKALRYGYIAKIKSLLVLLYTLKIKKNNNFIMLFS